MKAMTDADGALENPHRPVPGHLSFVRRPSSVQE
jgi:hypothetical protein